MKIGNIFYSVVVIILRIVFWINPNLLLNYRRYAIGGDGKYIGENIITIFAVFLVIYGFNKLLNAVGETSGK